MRVAPSILSANFACLGKDIRMAEGAGADWLHIDVMDGHFVPNITIGPPVVKSLKRVTRLFLDTHLMIEAPERYISSFASAGSDGITVHLEALRDPRKVIRSIRSCGCMAGFSIKPGTPVKRLLPFLTELDTVLVMSVEPGFGGQSFMPASLPKIKALRKAILRCGKDICLEVDGGINPETGAACAAAGADMLVAGNAVFGAKDPAAVIKKLKSIA